MGKEVGEEEGEKAEVEMQNKFINSIEVLKSRKWLL